MEGLIIDDNVVRKLNGMNPVTNELKFGEMIRSIAEAAGVETVKPEAEILEYIPAEIPFHVTGIIKPGEGAVSLLIDDMVGTRRVYIQGFIIKVVGDEDWIGEDTKGLSIKGDKEDEKSFFTVKPEALKGNALIVLGSEGVEIEDIFYLVSGGASGKGLVVCNDGAESGSDVSVTVFGLLK